MKVRAKLVSEKGREGRVVGYYGHSRIREGEVFELVSYKNKSGKTVTPDDQFSEKWMERLAKPVSKPAPTIAGQPSAAPAQAQDQSSEKTQESEFAESTDNDVI